MPIETTSSKDTHKGVKETDELGQRQRERTKVSKRVRERERGGIEVGKLFGILG